MVEKLLLFDQYERDYLGPAGYSESHFAFLNRSARRQFAYLRDLLQKWFDEFEADEQKRRRLRHEFRLDDSRKHLSAFFELYLHQLMTCLGFKVEVEPEWETNNPDFMLTTPVGDKVLLEATSVFSEELFGTPKKLENIVLDEINARVKSNEFFISIRIKSSPTGTPSYSRLCKNIETELSKLNRDEIAGKFVADGGLEQFPMIPVKCDAWDIELRVIPKKANANPNGRLIGMQFYPVRRVDPVAGIRESIKAKYRRYGSNLSIPYLLAINVFEHGFDEGALMEALFGTEAYDVDFDTGSVEPRRLPDGAWFSFHGSQKTRISGLIVFRHLESPTIGWVSPVLWHHPGAQRPFSPQLWALDQQVPNFELSRYELKKGISVPETLALRMDLWDE